jgi:hypothetical protein
MLTTLVSGLILAAGPAVEVRVDGPGMLRFMRDGRAVYAKRARLTVAHGLLVGPEGAATLPRIAVPSVPDALSIQPDGTVAGVFSGREARLGRLSLAIFECERTLTPSGPFWISAGRPATGRPGEAGAGLLAPARAAPVRAAPPAAGSETAQAPKPPAAAPAGRTVSGGFLRPAAPATPQVTVRPMTEVEQAFYTLGDVAEVLGPPPAAEALRRVVLGDTPPLGVERIIDRTRLDARIRAAGISTANVAISIPAGARVVRKGQRVTHAELVEAAIHGARAKLGPAGDFKPAGDGPDLVLPLGELRLTPEKVNASGARVSVVVAGYVDGARTRSRTVQLVRANMPVALRTGQNVKVRLRSNGVVLETSGRVVRAGQPGEPVTVQTDTGAQLTGRPDAMGVVEVEL